ncbi:MAG: hypothetical protein NVS1B9_07940 [Solirubrobacteraceae bacterium]
MTIEPQQDVAVIVAARNESDRIAATLQALLQAMPHARLHVADDASTDGTAALARAAGADVICAPRRLGKGGAATLAARRALQNSGPETRFLLCDGDLGASAARLSALLPALAQADLAVAVFARREGGGFGFAVGFARRTIRRLAALELRAPISGQRALTAACLEAVLPFEPRFGMEIGMTVRAARAGMCVVEVDLDLEHRAGGRTLSGFVHRARQLADFTRVAWAFRRTRS